MFVFCSCNRVIKAIVRIRVRILEVKWLQLTISKEMFDWNERKMNVVLSSLHVHV